ncbi:MAG TPA: hypothetical protein VGS97_05195 [Actinocrinis sp.]|uniref:hypothetical protein n=1 Tax=Actinocrinis sp. TaxID=1920516 RepID=UPI002DDCC53D|nr:hypothetical protein [Actinocrinis sp.]HEV2343469.1 hypothetical protein [Actinocrinis sp.]
MTFEPTAAGGGAAFLRAALPAAAPTTLLALGRWWHTQGAAHSLGDAALMTTLASATALCGALTVKGGGELPAYCLGAAGGLAAAAIAGYATGLALPLIVWAVSTAVTAVVGIRARRADTRAEREHAHQVERDRIHADTEIQREAIRAQSRIEAAQITGAWQARAAAITAATTPRYQIEPIDPGLLALSAEARAALASPTARLALEPPRPAADPIPDHAAHDTA